VKLFVAGRDRTGDLGEDLRRAAEARAAAGPAPRFQQPACSALTLRASADEREYLDRFQALLAIHHVVNPTSTVPRRDGLMGVVAARLRDWIWRQVQYRIARIVSRQNGINEQLVFDLALQNQALRRDLDALRATVERGTVAPRGSGSGS